MVSNVIDDMMNDMMRGRKIVLEKNGLDVSVIDSMTSKPEIMSYIENHGNKTEKNTKYLYSVACKRFLPETSDGGMSFRPFYDTAPQTSGDSAEVALQLMEIGRGHSVKREVKTAIIGSQNYNIFGSSEKLILKHRDSDLVVTSKGGKTVHIESKVGLTRGTKKKFDLMQECLGDVYRLENDPDTTQKYVIFRNAINGLSQLDDRDYVRNLYAMKKKYGERVKVYYESKYLSEKDLLLLSSREKHIAVKTCLEKSNFAVNGEVCSVDKPAINESTDATVRSVNGCNGITSRGKKIAKAANEHGKTSNFAVAYSLEPTPVSKFLSNAKAGAIQGAKHEAISSGINAVYEMMTGKKPNEQIVKDVILKTAKSAINAGLICGVSSLAQTKSGKNILVAGTGVILDSAKSFVKFCGGEIGVKDLMNSVLNRVVATGMNSVKAKAINSLVSAATAIGKNSAGAVIGGTGKASVAVSGLMKGIGGAFLACALAALIFCNVDKNAKIDLPDDARVTTLVEVDEKGYCTIKSSMGDNLIEKIVRYNDRLSEFEQKTNELKQKRAYLSQFEKSRIEKIIKTLNDEVNLLKNQILRQAKRKALEGSNNYHLNLRASVEAYVERQMTVINKQNIKLNELKNMEMQLRDEKKCCDRITECCNKIIHLGQSGVHQHEKIRELIANISKDLSDNPVLYKSNNYTTGADILVGCLVTA